MNSVLNDLTYCDGRFETEGKAAFSDSPSRLKLRSNTYQGICASLEKRRTPAYKNDFFIPSVALPEVQVQEGTGVAGGVVNDVKKDEFTYKDPAELGTTKGGASKKLKVGPVQLSGVTRARDKNMPESTVVNVTSNVEVKPIEEQVIPIAPAVELPKTSLPKVEPVVEKAPVVESAPIQPEPIKEEIETPVIDAKVESPTPVVNDSSQQENDNEKEEQVDEFASLQKVTEQYQQAAKEYDIAKQELDSAEKEMATSKEKLETTEKEITEKENELTNQRNVIDTARKDIASLQEEVGKVREEIKRKTIAIDKAREKKEIGRRELESKTKQTKETNTQYQQGIESNNKTLENLKKESQKLVDEENQVLSEKANVRSELEGLEEILKAITLPEGAEEYIEETREVQAPIYETENRTSFIPFDTTKNTNDVVIEQAPYEKSIGAYRAA